MFWLFWKNIKTHFELVSAYPSLSLHPENKLDWVVSLHLIYHPQKTKKQSWQTSVCLFYCPSCPSNLCYYRTELTTEKNIYKKMDKKQFYVIIEQDEDGIYIGEVPQLKACYSQGETIDELLINIREVIEICLEEIEEETKFSQFVGIQTISV